jgi:hypothetical protein
MLSKMPTWFLTLAALPISGCATGHAATSAAAKRFDCPPAMITVIDASLTDTTLDVCGQRQLWMLELGGEYEYIGTLRRPRRDAAKNIE